MGMLYWSSQLIEQEIRTVKNQVEGLQNNIEELRNDNQVVRQDILRSLLEDQQKEQQLLRQILEKQSEVVVASEKELQSSAIAETTDEALSPLVGEAAPILASVPDKGLATRAHIDANLPNLYTVDPFYQETLQRTLPEGFIPRGTRQEASLGHPDNLHPFSGWRDTSMWVGMCNVSVGGGHFGKYETYAPEMALKLEERIDPATGIPEYWVHLREGVYWQPLNPSHFPDTVQLAPHFLKKHPVTSHDYKFFLDAVLNPFNQEPSAVSLRNYLGDIEELRIVDDLTFVVRWKTTEIMDKEGKIVRRPKYIAKGWTGTLQPLARWVYQYFPDGTKILAEDSAPDTYRSNSVWAQNFAEHWAKNIIVCCGAWTFDGMTDRVIRFKRNPDHYDPYSVLVGGYEIRFKDSPDGIWQDFKAGKLDTFQLQPQKLVELEEFLLSDDYRKQKDQGLGIQRLDYPSRSYAYLAWNEASPLFESKRVRQAMTMAIDRERIIDQILNGMGVAITGPFFRNSPSNDASIKPWPFNPSEARRLLEAEGWYDSDGDGILDKEIGGERVPFRFGLTYYVKNPTTKAVAEYVVTALKEIGVSCQLHGVDIADLTASFEDKSFEALTLFWALGSPPEEPRQLWHSDGAKEKGSSNLIGFANSEADEIIESLQYEFDAKQRLRLYHRFHAIIHEEQPYTFLYGPTAVLLYRDYVQNVFIPADRQDLIPGADIGEPSSSIFWLKPH
ncbi:hypothetical protein SCG7086_AK_00110 [Chlamydiales bacterium SCGC AG-110-P3]|nr:hypothetical protein SCG7086_AK_00110 [Chlamydiales bacterium SCGC AG-110-P3]